MGLIKVLYYNSGKGTVSVRIRTFLKRKERKLKKLSRTLLTITGLLVFAVGVLIPVNSFAADVNIYVEGAYTESNLTVYIYGDIDFLTEGLRSAGVKLTYDTSELIIDSVNKNEAIWSLGEEYMDPDISIPGEVVIILGKFDIDNPTTCVSGGRILLGIVQLDRTESSMPFNPTLGIALGKENPYANFVDTDGNILDDIDVHFGEITIARRGDANADGKISISDAMLAKYIFQIGGYTCFADANADGKVSISDAMLIFKIYQTGG